jgi:hypothetical protein
MVSLIVLTLTGLVPFIMIVTAKTPETKPTRSVIVFRSFEEDDGPATVRMPRLTAAQIVRGA